MTKCICGKLIETGFYCDDDCRKERSRVLKLILTSKPNGLKQQHANNALSERWEMLWRLAPQARDLMYKIERQVPLCLGLEQHK